MARFLVEQKKEDCIGCGACVAVCPDFWELGDDGKAKLKGHEDNNTVIEEKDLECNKKAADACPVDVIVIKKIKD